MTNLGPFENQLRRIVFGDPILDALELSDLLRRIPRIDEMHDVPSGATVLLRADLDMPIEQGAVADTARIDATATTVEYCRARGWKTVIFGHLGRDSKTSVSPVHHAMSERIGLPIRMIRHWLDETRGRWLDEAVAEIVRAPNGTVIMLENTRKYNMERALWNATPEGFASVAKQMHSICVDARARVSDVELNEAIAASNMDFSSVALPLAMRRTGLGIFIHKEMTTYLSSVLRCAVVVFSGLKLNKLDDLEAIVERGRVRVVLVGGALSVALKKAEAQAHGSDFFCGLAETSREYVAFVDDKRLAQAKRVVKKCRQAAIDLVLPVDFVLDTDEVSATIPSGHAQMDVGPRSIELFKCRLRESLGLGVSNRVGGSVFVNGVLGKFEEERFASGTKAMILFLKELTNSGLEVFVGGGEGRQALARYGRISDVTHAFTCGGTVLKTLAGRHLPCLKAMYLQNVEDRQNE